MDSNIDNNYNTNTDISNKIKYIDSIKNTTKQWTERIDWDSYFMSMTFLIASRSCERLIRLCSCKRYKSY